MVITATELKENLGYYLAIVQEEDIVITKHGKSVAKLVNIKRDKLELLEALTGILPSDGMTLEEAKDERLSKK